MMADVVEHLVDPFETLRRVARVLRRARDDPDAGVNAGPLPGVVESTSTTSPGDDPTSSRRLENPAGYDRYHNLTDGHSTTVTSRWRRFGMLPRVAHRVKPLSRTCRRRRAA
jgi:hypothetical protein